MKLLVLLATVAAVACGAGWDSVQRIPVDKKIEVTTQNGTRVARGFHGSGEPGRGSNTPAPGR